MPPESKAPSLPDTSTGARAPLPHLQGLCCARGGHRLSLCALLATRHRAPAAAAPRGHLQPLFFSVQEPGTGTRSLLFSCLRGQGPHSGISGAGEGMREKGKLCFSFSLIAPSFRNRSGGGSLPEDTLGL